MHVDNANTLQMTKFVHYMYTISTDVWTTLGAMQVNQVTVMLFMRHSVKLYRYVARISAKGRTHTYI